MSVFQLNCYFKLKDICNPCYTKVFDEPNKSKRQTKNGNDKTLSEKQDWFRLVSKIYFYSQPTVAERSKVSVFLDRGRGRSGVQIPAMPNLIIFFLLEIGSI